MKLQITDIQGLVVFEKQKFIDSRGYFFESYNKDWFTSLGVNIDFWQDNVSFSKKGVLRGLHFQTTPFEQAKLVQVLQGTVFDVAIDLRKNSKTYKRWHAETLSETNGKTMFIPEGFAHGFLVLSESALFSYKCSSRYSYEHSMIIKWDDPELNIIWPENPEEISEKDKNAITLNEYEKRLG